MNTWPKLYRHAMTQSEHDLWNQSHYPGTRQLCKTGRIDPILLTFDRGRATQKAKYLGELFPAECVENASGKTFLEFFAVDKGTGNPKGIVAIDLRGL